MRPCQGVLLAGECYWPEGVIPAGYYPGYYTSGTTRPRYTPVPHTEGSPPQPDLLVYTGTCTFSRFRTVLGEPLGCISLKLKDFLELRLIDLRLIDLRLIDLRLI